MNKKTLIFLFSISFVFIFSVGVWYFSLKNPIKKAIYSINNTPTSVLETSNQDYKDAISYEKSRKYDLALLSYQKALPNAQDRTQVAQILLKIAIMNEWMGNYAEAISRLKTIAADTTNYSIARAYAVQEIGFMNVYTEGVPHELVLRETFKDTPYSSFKKGDNLNLTYTKLFEYAASIYPLGYSESYIAYGYSGEIINTLRGATTTEQGKEYVALTEKSLQSAQNDIRRMKLVPGEAVFVPTALAWQGVALSRLAAVGVLDPKQAEPYFKDALAYGATIGDKPGSFNAFNYAAFLVYHYGYKRSDEIKKVLSPFRTDNSTQIYPQVISFYREAYTSRKLSEDKKIIISLGKTDKDFRSFLISLGWKDSDFQ